MLKGYLKCSDISKMLLPYVQFELNRKNTSKVARHLRNCPICMEKYSNLQKRKKEMRQRLIEVEKRLRMQIELSAYCDNEASDELKFIVEGMLRYDENYKNELIEYEKLRRYIQSTKEYIKNTGKTPYSNKIIAKLKLENIRRKRVKNAISRLVQPLRHVIAKYV